MLMTVLRSSVNIHKEASQLRYFQIGCELSSLKSFKERKVPLHFWLESLMKGTAHTIERVK